MLVLHTSQNWCSKRRKRLVRRENSIFRFQGGKMKIIARFTYFSKMVSKRRKRLVRRENSGFLFQCVKMKIIARLHTSQK